ncbi:MAG: hypothetical protein LC104_22165 [Bacteroidales bacterium]|nr:hypothetical protein [Bacteroidales bacterium]
MEKTICVRDRSGNLTPGRDRVGDMPGVFGFRRNEQFVAEQWLYESTFNWGHHSQRRDAYGHKGSRSVFYVALRLLFFLGVRTVYLLGCDFRMEIGRANYAFDQDRTPASIRGNNATYRILNARLRHLLPYFEKEGFRVFNCTPNSGLTVFPAREYHEALDHATNHISRHLNTTGMYTYQPAHAARKGEAQAFSPSGIPRSDRHIQRSIAVPLTVVAGWTPHTDTQLGEALRTWICAFSGFMDVPVLVVHASDELPKWTPESRFSDRSDSVTLVPGRRYGDHTMPEIDLVSVACTAETPWVLILPKPFLLASGAVGIHPEWFVGPYVDYLTDHQPRVVSAQIEEHIHSWAQTVPPLYRFRGENRLISALSGPFLARTQWLRGLQPILASAPPTIPRSLILGAIAAWRGDAGRKVDWRTAGWEIILDP